MRSIRRRSWGIKTVGQGAGIRELRAAVNLDGAREDAVARIEFKSVDEYIASQPEGVREILGRVRRSIRKAVPAADEIISYGMPTYRLNGARLLYFAVWKKHYSIYAATEQVLAEFRQELASHEVDKGTIRFALSEPVPVSLISRIAKFRAKEVAGTRRRE